MEREKILIRARGCDSLSGPFAATVIREHGKLFAPDGKNTFATRDDGGGNGLWSR
jgi:hypothetical protein